MNTEKDNCFIFNHPNDNNLNEIHKLESISFPDDEAATLDTILFRGRNALKYFYQLRHELDNKLVGFVNATCTSHNKIYSETMKTHESNGNNLVIHSITVCPDHRRQGIGKLLLTKYLTRIADYNPEIHNVYLLCKGHLISFYTSCGFTVVSVSDVCHGKDQWFEMKININQMRFTQLQIDAFTSDPYKGNPAAVVFSHGNNNNTDNKTDNGIWMQNIANENNLAETAFLKSKSIDELYAYEIRWFTPTREVELCGHATLAAAYALYETYRVPKHKQIKFYTFYNDILYAHMNKNGTIELTFPSTPISSSTTSDTTTNAANTTNENNLSEIKNIINNSIHLRYQNTNTTSINNPTTTTSTTNTTSNNLIEFCGRSKYDILVTMRWEDFIQIESIDFEKLKQIDARGVIVTCLSHNHIDPHIVNTILNLYKEKNDMIFLNRFPLNNKQIDFMSRCFFPRYGINEDPVTGSAHCTLAPFWMEQLLLLQKQKQNNDQLSPSSFSTSSESQSSLKCRKLDNSTSISTIKNDQDSRDSTDNNSNNNDNKYQELVGYQASNRGGYVTTYMKDYNDDIVHLKGSCVTIFKCQFIHF